AYLRRGEGIGALAPLLLDRILRACPYFSGKAGDLLPQHADFLLRRLRDGAETAQRRLGRSEIDGFLPQSPDGRLLLRQTCVEARQPRRHLPFAFDACRLRSKY